jgi:o-succinylbenzoate---CoA ligase
MEWPSNQVKRSPDMPFVVTGAASTTFAEAEEMIERAVGHLAARIEAAELVGVIAAPTVRAVVTMLAIPKAGGIVLPISPAFSESEVRDLCSRFEATLVDPADVDGPEAAPREIDPAAPYAVFATSGSTGLPKGVVLTMGNLVAAADASASFLDHRPGDRWLAVLPLNHVGGFSILTRSMRVGGTVVLEPRFDPERVASLLHEVEFASLVPTMLADVVSRARGSFEGLKTVLVGGGPLPEGLLDAARAAGIPAVPTYGATETAAQVATGRPGSQAVAPLPGVEMTIEDGEIVIDGPMVSPGYWRQPPRVGPYRTGDAGRIDVDGNLTVLGRLDDLVISGGENVYPAEVERVLLSHPGVLEAVVTGVDDSRWGRVLRASVVAPGLSDAALQAWVRERLAGYKVPKQWEFLMQIPRTDLGKPKRSAK